MKLTFTLRCVVPSGYTSKTPSSSGLLVRCFRNDSAASCIVINITFTLVTGQFPSPVNQILGKEVLASRSLHTASLHFLHKLLAVVLETRNVAGCVFQENQLLNQRIVAEIVTGIAASVSKAVRTCFARQQHDIRLINRVQEFHIHLRARIVRIRHVSHDSAVVFRKDIRTLCNEIHRSKRLAPIHQ